ncbi:MAG: phosphoglycerate mutase [Chromatiaceae bacterium]|nr:phosphoglycerate mutase [Chromatiaceae bacterium]
MGENSQIDLVIPGLFGPIPVFPEDLPELSALSGFLGKAESRPALGRNPIAVLFDRFGIELDPSADPPSAPFSRLADTPNATPGGYWLHADPVHLRPDRNQLLLFDARHLRLNPDEADSLAKLFNEQFAADGLCLETPTADHWYLRADSPPRLHTRPLADQIGRRIDRTYLRGEDAARWMGWLNEVQMLFHHADPNRRRETAGRPMVSGIWIWGGGSLPAAMPHCRYRTVYAGDSLTRGLAMAARIAAYPLPDRLQAPDSGVWPGPMLVFWDALWPAVLDADAGVWVRELARLADLLGELMALLRGGKLGEIAIYPCDGTRLSATRRSLRRFWRRPVRIAARLQGRPEN